MSVFIFFTIDKSLRISNWFWSVMTTTGGCVCRGSFAMTTGTSIRNKPNDPTTSTLNCKYNDHTLIITTFLRKIKNRFDPL